MGARALLIVIVSAFSLGTPMSVANATEMRSEKTLKPDFTKLFSQQSADCEVGKNRFRLNLGTEEKEADPEYSGLGYPYFWITSEGGKPVAGLPSLEHNQLLFLDPKSESVCKGTFAIALKDGTVWIFLQQSGRPFQDRLSVSIFDPKKGKVVTSQRDLGPSSKIEKGENGPVYLIRDQPSDIAQFTVTVKGQISTTTEEVFEYWARPVRKGTIVTSEFDRALTWTRSSYKNYFKSRAEFEKAFGWDGKKKIYSMHWVYRVKTPDCIAPDRARKADDPKVKWYCS